VPYSTWLSAPSLVVHVIVAAVEVTVPACTALIVGGVVSAVFV
jgi:hypothetical protein